MGEGEEERRREGLGAGRGPSGPGSQREPRELPTALALP